MNSHVRVLPSHRCTAMAPFRANGIPFSVAASRAQLRASGLSSLCSFTSGSAPETAAAAGDYTSSDAYELVFPAKSIARKADFSFRPKIGRYQAKKRRFLPRRHYISEEKKSLLVFTAFLCFFIGCFTTYGFCSIRLFPLLAPFEESRLRNAELFSSCAGA